MSRKLPKVLSQPQQLQICTTTKFYRQALRKSFGSSGWSRLSSIVERSISCLPILSFRPLVYLYCSSLHILNFHFLPLLTHFYFAVFAICFFILCPFLFCLSLQVSALSFSSAALAFSFQIFFLLSLHSSSFLFLFFVYPISLFPSPLFFLLSFPDARVPFPFRTAHRHFEKIKTFFQFKVRFGPSLKLAH